MEKKIFTVLSGDSFSVLATSEDEALAKFYVSQGHVDEEEYEGEGFDFSNLDEDVEESETLTEVM
jgi:hypothetical protein